MLNSRGLLARIRQAQRTEHRLSVCTIVLVHVQLRSGYGRRRSIRHGPLVPARSRAIDRRSDDSTSSDEASRPSSSFPRLNLSNANRTIAYRQCRIPRQDAQSVINQRRIQEMRRARILFDVRWRMRRVWISRSIGGALDDDLNTCVDFLTISRVELPRRAMSELAQSRSTTTEIGRALRQLGDGSAMSLGGMVRRGSVRMV